MAAFNDALDLKTAVGDHVGNRTISDVWPRLVQMAEAELNKKLRTVYQVKSVELTFTDGEADLPTDFVEMLHTYGPDGYQFRAGLRADFQRDGVSYATYSIGEGKVYIRGFSGDKTIQYYASLPTLSASLSASNWLLESNPEVYLYAVGMQAAKYLRDIELATTTKALFDEAMRHLMLEDERYRWANSVVRVQGQTP